MDNLQLAKTTKTLLVLLACTVAVFAAVGLAVIFLAWPFSRPMPYLCGLALGGGLSAARTLMLSRSLRKTVDMERGQAKNSTQLQFILRYFMTVGVLAISVFLNDYINLIGTVLGIFALHVAGQIAGGVERRQEEARFAANGPPPPLPEDEEDDGVDSETSFGDFLKNMFK